MPCPTDVLVHGIVRSYHLRLIVFLKIACCNAIRNVVSRSNSADSKAAFVNLEVEELLHAVRNAHPSAADAVKAALRDLDLKVELKEEWTGSGGKLG